MPGAIKGIEAFTRYAARLEAVGRLREDGPKICATAIGDVARPEMAAGRSPNGAQWDPRKKDGAPALANAPVHVTFRAVGNGIYEVAPDHYKYHRTGTKNPDGSLRMVKRNVYAEGSKLPAAWQRACNKALKREFEKRMKG